MTIPIIWSGIPCTPLGETIFPTSDQETSGWGSTPLWSKLDDNSDSDFVTSNSSDTQCPSSQSFDFTVNMDSPSGTPASTDCQELVARVRCRSVVNFGSGQVDIRFDVRQSGTLIAQQTFTDISTSFTTKSFTLTDAEFNNITNHSQLRAEVTATICVDDEFSELECDVAWIEFEYVAK